MNKLFKIMEIIWLVTAGFTAIVAVYFLITKQTDPALFFIFAFLISSVLYLLRKYQRKKHDAFLASQPQANKPGKKK